jgi:hypothetical protein
MLPMFSFQSQFFLLEKVSKNSTQQIQGDAAMALNANCKNILIEIKPVTVKRRKFLTSHTKRIKAPFGPLEKILIGF